MRRPPDFTGCNMSEISAAVTTASDQMLSGLLSAGLLGMVGQGARAVVGLQKKNHEAQAAGVRDPFIAGRLIMSLFVGFIAGVVAALSLGLCKILSVEEDNAPLFLGVAAAGYAGTDFIDAFARKLGAAPRRPGRGGGGGATHRGSRSSSSASARLDENQPEACPAARDAGLSDEAARALLLLT
jgi:hypothetical protein